MVQNWGPEHTWGNRRGHACNICLIKGMGNRQQGVHSLLSGTKKRSCAFRAASPGRCVFGTTVPLFCESVILVDKKRSRQSKKSRLMIKRKTILYTKYQVIFSSYSAARTMQQVSNILACCPCIDSDIIVLIRSSM